MKLLQKQIQKLSQQQLQSIEMLQMSTLELDVFLRDLAQENPLVELCETSSVESERPQHDDLIRRLRWLEDNNHQNHYYQKADADELDPIALVGNAGGLEETLQRFISRQLDRMGLEPDLARTIEYIAACLDEDGYFRFPLEELSEQTGLPLSHLERALKLLHTLEPAGVGAIDLSQCLELQLLRIGESGPALSIVRDHLEALARHHYRTIASKLSISVVDVQNAERSIRELEPRPGAVFQQPTPTLYIQPDVFVDNQDGSFVVSTRNSNRSPILINSYYRKLLAQSDDKEVRDYLATKLHQAEHVIWAIEQRESTLKRCAQAIVDHQQDFFRYGPQTLSPLRMIDLAQELGVHESTISRTVREKYLQCARGVYPLSYFFSRSATALSSRNAIGGTAARILLKQLVDEEDKQHPFSDQKLCELLAEMGCSVSRRTVAKYREEMSIPGTSGRKITPQKPPPKG